jgi:hypothetical protein
MEKNLYPHIMLVIKDGHGDKDVLHIHDEWMDVSY